MYTCKHTYNSDMLGNMIGICICLVMSTNEFNVYISADSEKKISWIYLFMSSYHSLDNCLSVMQTTENNANIYVHMSAKHVNQSENCFWESEISCEYRNFKFMGWQKSFVFF